MTILVVDCNNQAFRKHVARLCGGARYVQFVARESAKELLSKKKFSAILAFGIDGVRELLPHLPKIVLVMYKIQFRELVFHSSGSVIPLFVCPSLQDIKKQKADEKSYKIARDRFIKRITKAKPYQISLDYNYQQVKTVTELKQVFARLKQEPIVAFDIETVGLFPFKQQLSRPTIHTIAFAFEDGDVFALPVETYWKPATQVAVKQALAKWLVELAPDQIRIAHNSKFELKWMLEHCLPAADLHWRTSRPVGKYEDTQLLMWSLHGQEGTNSLKFAAPLYLGVPNWGIDVSDVRQQPLDKLLHYNALDSFYTLRLWQRIHPMVASEPDLLSMYENVLVPASCEFVQVELRGVPYDRKKASEYANQYKNIKAKAMQDIVSLAGQHLVPTEPEALIRYFQGKGYSWDGTTDSGGIAMGEAQLKQIEEKYNEPICSQILAFKKAGKNLTTYVEGPQKFLASDNTIKATYNLTKTITGRTSSDSPNMQNFPKRKGKEIRECFVAPPGYVFASFDYGQIEARLFGVLTGDKQFCKDLFSGVDMHQVNADFVFGKDGGPGTRDKMKGGTFGALYGSSIGNLENVLGITKSMAERMVAFIFNKYPEFKKWQKRLMTMLKNAGYVAGLTGRRRREPMTYNEALNHPLQSSASDLTFLLKEEDLEDQISEILEAMLVLPWLYIYKSKYNKAWIPLQVEVEVGSNWANQEPVLKADCLEIGITNQKQCIQRAEELHKYFMNYKQEAV